MYLSVSYFIWSHINITFYQYLKPRFRKSRSDIDTSQWPNQHGLGTDWHTNSQADTAQIREKSGGGVGGWRGTLVERGGNSDDLDEETAATWQGRGATAEKGRKREHVRESKCDREMTTGTNSRHTVSYNLAPGGLSPGKLTRQYNPQCTELAQKCSVHILVDCWTDKYWSIPTVTDSILNLA